MINTFKQLFFILIYVCTCVVSFFIPKKRNSIVIFCNEAGLFGGNIRAISFFIKNNKHTEVTIISFSKQTTEELLKLGFHAQAYPSLKATWSFLRAKLLIIECGLRIELCGLAGGSKVVQIWHGANLKYMVKGWYQFQKYSNPFEQLVRYIKINYPQYRFIVSPSEFYKENTFKTSFNSREVFVAGYPRNDLFFRADETQDEVGSSMDLVIKAKKHREAGGKVLVYCPTWRDNSEVNENVIPFIEESLIRFLEKNNIYLVVKKHHRDKRTPIPKNHPLVDVYPHDKDVYLLLKYSDLLITDYSSIYFDYLLLNKPVVFYPYDYETYVTRDRLFQYPYDDFTPGKKCLNENDLYEEILNALNNSQYYFEEREKIKTIAFGSEPCANSSEKIWNKCLEVLKE
jgi:CDP-glycerol glycerophosphotransferase (TagB/SpsB family)